MQNQNRYAEAITAHRARVDRVRDLAAQVAAAKTTAAAGEEEEEEEEEEDTQGARLPAVIHAHFKVTCSSN